jgi:hypothetical protein
MGRESIVNSQSDRERFPAVPVGAVQKQEPRRSGVLNRPSHCDLKSLLQAAQSR